MARIEALSIEPGLDVPNAALPVLLYRAAFAPSPDLADQIERRFRANGWRGTWLNGIYTYHHFHPDAHEVLGIAEGEATVQLGGEAGPVVTLHAGDVVVLPAGTGHKRLAGSPDLLVVGGYPPDQTSFRTLRGDAGRDAEERAALAERAAGTPLPMSDPVEGENGMLGRLWRPDD